MENTNDQRILVLAPLGRDAECIVSVLQGEGLQCEVCADMSELCAKQADGAGAAVIAEEALPPASLAQLQKCLQQQEKWSDLPIVVLTSSGETTQPELR